MVMGPIAIGAIVVGSVCCAAALLHGFIFFRRPDLKANLWFALMALGVAASALAELWVYSATTVEAFNRAFKAQITSQGLLWICLIWFVVFYTHTTRYWAAFALTAALSLVILIQLMLPFGVLFAEITQLRPINSAWGEQLVFADGPPSLWTFVAYSLLIFLAAFVIDSCVQLSRRGDSYRALVLGASLAVFLGFGWVHGIFIDRQIVDPPILLNYTFFGLILVMSSALADEVVRASVLAKEVVANERRWGTLLQNVPLLVVGIEPDGRINYVNPHFAAVSGFSAEEAVGRAFIDFVLPRECADLLERARTAGHGSVQPHVQATLLTKAGTQRTIYWSSVLLHDAGGALSGTLNVGIDVTGQLEAETTRDRAVQDLRAAVHELQVLKTQLEEENIYLKEEIREYHGFRDIIGQSNALLYVLTKVQQVAGTHATVLIEGETGVGKELIARAIHQASHRSEKPFIKVNCAVLPANLIESELFGHEPGAFTGATRLRKGRFELADGGTIFLDEIIEMPLELQAKLLRVLQEREFERLGGSRTLSTDARVIAATNRSLKAEVAAGRFREDLFYRLNVYPITVPPLRNRREDIPLLVRHFVPQIASRMSKSIDQVPRHVMQQLTEHDWPGNIRELRNVIESTVITSPDSVLRLPEGFRMEAAASTFTSSISWPKLDEVQRQYMLKVLHKTNGQIEGAGGAAEILGLKPSTLRSRLQRLGVR